MTKRAVIYTRVSTDEQAEKGYSLPTQLEACQQYAAASGFMIAAQFREEGISGARLDRPGLDKLRSMIALKQIDVVIVYTADRLSRNLAHSLILREEFHKAGIELHYVDRGKAQDTAEGRLTQNVEAVIAEYEREKIRERTRRGANEKAESGKWVGKGYAPYGYRREGRANEARLVIDEAEAAIVQDMFRWYTSGDETNGPLSLLRIALKLDGKSIAPPKHRRNAARRWFPSTVRGILKNETYVGCIQYGKTKSDGKRRVQQLRDNWLVTEIPELAIVDRATFEAARVRVERNKELSKRNRRRDYLLSGFLRCAVCGGAMSGGTADTSLYYRCKDRWHRPYKDPCPMRGKTIACRVVDTKAWDWLSGLIEDDHKLKEGFRHWRARNSTQAQPLRAQLASLIELHARESRRAERLGMEYARAVGSDDEAEVDLAAGLKEQWKLVNKSRDSLEVELAKTKTKLEGIELTEEREQTIRARLMAIRARLAKPTVTQKRETFDLFNFTAKFRADDTGRWLDVSCELKGEETIELPHRKMIPPPRQTSPS